MCRSSARWRGSASGIAQPAQPLPNLCPTSGPLPRMGLPNLPDLSGVLACIGMQGSCNQPYVRKQVGQVGQVGQCKRWRGFRLPDLLARRSVRPGKWRSDAVSRGGREPERQPEPNVKRYSPARVNTGQLARNLSLVAGLELWFNAPLAGSSGEFNGVAA